MKLEIGNFLSEISYYKVTEVLKNGNIKALTRGEEITLGKEYVEKLLVSAHHFDSTENINRTELIQKVLENPRTAMSIQFQKAEVKKTQKAFKAEKEAKIKQVQEARTSDITSLLSDLIDNPILTFTPGDIRIIVGYHEGYQDERGYLSFFDAEKDNVFKAINPRTFAWAIINKVKYIVK